MDRIEDTVIIDGKSYPRSKLRISSGTLRPWEKKTDEELKIEEEEALKVARDNYVYEVFQIFDLDGSGTIDVKEFQELAFCLGETLTDEEAKAYVAEIDLDHDGTIDFKEFIAWWQKAPPSSSTDDSKLQILKLRLQSKAYMKTVTRLLDRTKEALSKEGILPKERKPRSTTEPADSFSTNFVISAGTVGSTPGATVELQLEHMDGVPNLSAAAYLSVCDDASLDDIVNLLATIKAGIELIPKNPTVPSAPTANIIEVDGKKKNKNFD